MANLGGTYTADPNDIAGDYTPIPPGDYVAHIYASEMKPTKDNRGNYLQLEIEILEGEHAGRKLTDRLNLDNPNAQAEEIARRSLNAICVAVDKISISDSDELHGIPLIAVIKVDPPKPYMKDGVEHPGSPQNSIKTYKPKSGSASAQSKPAAAAAEPKAETSTPPWKKKAA